jgi:outer membrane protein assembly factor BamE (lipoprotein component of BamABCDE complex)
MRRLSVIPAALAALAAVFVAGCSTSGYDRTVTSSIGPRVEQQNAKQRYSGMVTQDRTGYVTRRIQP